MAELRQHVRVGAVCPTVVVDNEFVFVRVFARLTGRFRAIALSELEFWLGRRWEGRFVWVRGILTIGVRMFEAADKELAREGDVDRDVTVHSMFAEKIDAELFARFGEAELAVEGENVGEDAAALVIVDKFEELLG